jgi:hypothetical protein
VNNNNSVGETWISGRAFRCSGRQAIKRALTRVWLRPLTRVIFRSKRYDVDHV